MELINIKIIAYNRDFLKKFMALQLHPDSYISEN